MRHELVQRIVRAYDAYEEQKQKVQKQEEATL